MIDFTVLVLEGAFASSVALSLDVLASAARMAGHYAVAPPRWRVASVSGGPVALSNGLQVPTQRLPQRATADASVWIVPGLGINTPAGLSTRLEQADAVVAARAIATHARRGGNVAASCSAVFLLQAAGVLNGKTVTTTWWLASHLRRTLLGGTVDAQRMVIADGQVTTAGAALAHTDLMLHLLRKHSSALADGVSRALLIDQRSAQAQYVIPAVLASGDALVSQLSARIEAALPQVPGVHALAQSMGMSERTLARHVMAATGLGPLALIQQVRLARARVLLEKSRMSVDQVAEQVGYQDATALRRLMKKTMGLTPSQLRSTVRTQV